MTPAERDVAKFPALYYVCQKMYEDNVGDELDPVGFHQIIEELLEYQAEQDIGAAEIYLKTLSRPELDYFANPDDDYDRYGIEPYVMDIIQYWVFNSPAQEVMDELFMILGAS